MTTQQIEQGYETIIAMIAEYEKHHQPATIDGFTLWLLRKKALELEQHKQFLKTKIESQVNGEFKK